MSTVSVRHHALFIDGRSVDTDAAYELRFPATGELVRTVARGGVPEADAAVEAARRAHVSGVWSRRAPEERAAILERIADRIGSDMEELVELEILANGATVRQATGFHVGLAAPSPDPTTARHRPKLARRRSGAGRPRPLSFVSGSNRGGHRDRRTIPLGGISWSTC